MFRALGSQALRTVARRPAALAPRLVLRRTFAGESIPTPTKPVSLWNNAKFWGDAGAIAGWGMSLAAIYDAYTAGPELISLRMTGVMVVYSSLFARWAWVVNPRLPLLMSCHIANIGAQLNQLRRAIQHKIDQGQSAEVQDMAMKAGALAAGGIVLVLSGPALQRGVVAMSIPLLSPFAGAAAGPFTTHFWAPMSKWMISGASFMDLDRPVERVSYAQYTALTLTGVFFSRLSMLVNPINYMLLSVNVALFGSSAWHLGRKLKADFIDDKTKKEDQKAKVVPVNA